MKTTKYSIPNTNRTTQNTKHTKYQKHELGLGPELQTVSFPSQRMNEPKDKLNDAAWIKVLDVKKVKLLGYFNPPLSDKNWVCPNILLCLLCDLWYLQR